MAQSHTYRTADGNVWSQDDATTALSFTIEDENVTNVALADSINDSYVTAIGENTQYLSVLETSHGDITLSSLQDLEMNDGNVGIATEENTLTNIDIGGQQVMVFTMEGSDDLYGIQLAEDSEGNLQKFQFKFRTTDDGQLEAIPESIQLLPVDDNELVVSDQIGAQSIECNEENGNIYITKSAQPKKLFYDRNPTEEILEHEETEEQVDSKIGILDQIHVKSEINHDETEEEMLFNNDEENEIEDYHQVINYTVDEIGDNQFETETHEETNEEHLNMYTDDEDGLNKKQLIAYQELNTTGAYNEIFVEENSNMTSENDETEQLSDTEFEIVEGVHITGDVVGDNEELNDDEPVLQQMLSKNAENIQNNKPDCILKENNQNNRAVLYYVVPQPEKENVNSLLYKQNEKANPRSILKSSYAVQQTAIVKHDPFPFQKRFARSKQAVEARQFHNFISNTSIVQAPTRSERLPRKQQIKPVNERSDEEIIVKEVMVSKNTFVEDIPKEQLPSNGYVEYIDLSDTDEEYDPKGKKRRKANNVKRLDGVSSESELSVIEIQSDDDDKCLNRRKDVKCGQKRGRGRPPKHSIIPECKKEYKCPHCPKAFPSTNSLNTHVQHHSLENRLRNQVNKQQLFEYKHKCTKCEQKFKNSVLLKRHECKLQCTICRRVFDDGKCYQQHRIVHSKQRLLTNTSLVAVSPKKMRTNVNNVSRCKCFVCLKVFANDVILKQHIKCHKMYECKTCLNCFSSQILLNAHLRHSCMKKRSTLSTTTTTSGGGECAVKCQTNNLLMKQKGIAQKRVHGGIPLNNRLRMATRKTILHATKDS